MKLFYKSKIFNILKIIILTLSLLLPDLFAWLPHRLQDKEELIKQSKQFVQMNGNCPKLIYRDEVKYYIDKTLDIVYKMDIDENLKKDSKLMKTVIKIFLVAEYLDIMTGWNPDKAGQRLIKNATLWEPENTVEWLRIWWKYEPTYFLYQTNFINSICYNNICCIIGSESYIWRKHKF